MCQFGCGASDLVSLLGERREERSSHRRDALLESHREAVVELLRADDAVLARVHHKAAQARVGRVRWVELRQEILVVHSDNAGDVIFTFEGFNLAQHGALVLLDGLGDDAR